MNEVVSSPSAASGSPAGRRAWVHFGVAAAVLLVVGAGWNSIMAVLRWSMAKKPVPPPAVVRVNAKQRLVSFPERVGSFVLVKDGVVDVDDDTLKTLGTKANDMNWYYFAFYRDDRPGRGVAGDVPHVRLEVTYYTGLLDAVPHVPELCLVASGATLLTGQSGTLEVSAPAAPAPWDRMRVYRTIYEMPDHATRSATYYVFSMNGRPTPHWEEVRLHLTLPWVKYCYFAKIQLAVFRGARGKIVPETDFARCDEVCQDFFRQVLPEILRFLPSARDVERFEAGGSPGTSSRVE